MRHGGIRRRVVVDAAVPSAAVRRPYPGVAAAVTAVAAAVDLLLPQLLAATSRAVGGADGLGGSLSLAFAVQESLFQIVS